MNLKDEFEKALKLDSLERVPCSYFGGGVWTIYNSGNTFEEIGHNAEKYSETLIKTQEKIGNNVVYTNSGFNNFLPISLGGELKKRSPFLNLAPDMKAAIVKTEDDIGKLDAQTMEKHPFITNVRKGTKMVIDKIGSKVEVATTCWGPFTLAGQMRGVSDLLMDLRLNPKFADHLVEVATDLIVDFYKPYAEMGIDMASIAEPTASGDMISLPQVEKVVMPSLKRCISALKSLGIPHSLLHICGWTEDRLGRMPNTGADIFSLDHRVNISLARDALKQKMAYGGNVDPVKILKEGKPEDVARATRECIDKAWYGAGYVVMPGCDLPDAVSFENLQTFLDTARTYSPRIAA